MSAAVEGVILVESPGLYTTVQDLGRPGQARIGISAAGAADPVALRIANRLAGNAEGAAALEMTLAGGTFRFDAAAIVALAGADMQAQIVTDTGAFPLPPLAAARIPAGGRLACGAARAGARTVVAIGGGVRVEPWLGSASTHAGSRLGGFAGRALMKGDRLPFDPAPAPAPDAPTPGATAGRPVILRRLASDPLPGAAPAPAGPPAIVLRVTAGAQWDQFVADARDRFASGEYTVSAASDRMGLRLDGAPLSPPGGGRMLTEGMPLGAVQVPPAGRPVILFVDHQTTGGYPVIAAVISADLPRVGQLRPNARVRFEVVGLDAALAHLVELEARIAAARPVPA